jgi:hypothetical protein
MAYIRGLLYPVIDYQREYKGDDTVNYAKGEVSKFKMANPPKDIWIGCLYLGDGKDEKGEYDTIHIYIGAGWFKLISKVY